MARTRACISSTAFGSFGFMSVTPRRQTSSISDGDEVRFIASNGAGDVIPWGGPMRGNHVVDKLSRGLAEAEGKCTGARKLSGN